MTAYEALKLVLDEARQNDSLSKMHKDYMDTDKRFSLFNKKREAIKIVETLLDSLPKPEKPKEEKTPVPLKGLASI